MCFVPFGVIDREHLITARTLKEWVPKMDPNSLLLMIQDFLPTNWKTSNSPWFIKSYNKNKLTIMLANCKEIPWAVKRYDDYGLAWWFFSCLIRTDWFSARFLGPKFTRKIIYQNSTPFTLKSGLKRPPEEAWMYRCIFLESKFTA